MIKMLLFQVFRTENTALQSKFHVLGFGVEKLWSGVETSSEQTQEQFWDFGQATLHKGIFKCFQEVSTAQISLEILIRDTHVELEECQLILTRSGLNIYKALQSSRQALPQTAVTLTLLTGEKFVSAFTASQQSGVYFTASPLSGAFLTTHDSWWLCPHQEVSSRTENLKIDTFNLTVKFNMLCNNLYSFIHSFIQSWNKE